jgi:hypothetical protein
MASLSEHLVTGHEHGRLRFHPDCPICRSERVAGRLPNERLISPRISAGTAAAVLAASALIPSASAVAAPVPDQEQEGQAAPDAVSPGDSAHGIDFDPGGGDALPDEGGSTGQPPSGGAPDPGTQPEDAGSPEDGTPSPETEPVQDQEALGAEGDEQGAGDPSASVPEPGKAPEPGPPGTEPVQGTPAAGEQETVASPHPGRTERVEHRAGARRTASPAPARAAPKGSIASGRAEPVSATTGVAGTGAGQADSGSLFHIVRPGESLWSIASDLLGSDASPAELAREVDRLWHLNAERIGTGRPDLILPGMKLRLR